MLQHPLCERTRVHKSIGTIRSLNCVKKLIEKFVATPTPVRPSVRSFGNEEEVSVGTLYILGIVIVRSFFFFFDSGGLVAR